MCVSSEAALNTPELVSEPQEMSRAPRITEESASASGASCLYLLRFTELLKPTDVLDLCSSTEVEVVILDLGLSRDELWLLIMTDLTLAGLGGVRRREVPMCGLVTRGLAISRVSERARLGRDWYWPHLAPASSSSLTQSRVVAPMVTVTGLALASCRVSSWGRLMVSLSGVRAGGCDRRDTDNTSGGDKSGATSDNLFLIIITGLSSGVEVRENAPES